MTPEELHNIYRAEQEFWWYRGMRLITHALLDPALRQGVVRGLDAGCGTGCNALDWERRYGVRMYGIDREPLAVRYCRRNSFERSAVASITRLPFADGTFDFVASVDVLPVLPPGADDEAIGEFARVLRPGGYLLLRAAAFRSLRSRHSLYVAERHRYRAREILAKLARARFQVIRWTYVNAALSPAAWVKFRVWENLWRIKPQSGVAQIPPAWLNRLLFLALKAEAALIRRGVSFPFGQSVVAVARAPARED